MSHVDSSLPLWKKFFEEYKKFDTLTAWECFVDEVNRIQSVIELHDFLVECNKEDLKLLLERFEGWFWISKIKDSSNIWIV